MRRAGTSGRVFQLFGGLVAVAAGCLGYAVSRRIAAGSGSGRKGAGRIRSRSPSSVTPNKLHAASAALSFSVLADSGMEHYRGGFHNSLMYLAPAVSAATLLVATSGVGGRATGRVGKAAYLGAIATGLVGAGFHVVNVRSRVGGWRWGNLFYGAPLAAPLGLVFAGGYGLTAVANDEAARANCRPDPGIARAVAVASAAGLLGTAGEAGLLHYRGAFHDPWMYLPVTLPPLAAAAVAYAALVPNRQPVASASRTIRTRLHYRYAFTLLRITQALGLAGSAFHAFGVGRNMGGWRNWSQNLLQGPPLPAPPSFTGMALAGEAALLALLDVRSPETKSASGRGGSRRTLLTPLALVSPTPESFSHSREDRDE